VTGWWCPLFNCGSETRKVLTRVLPNESTIDYAVALADALSTRNALTSTAVFDTLCSQWLRAYRQQVGRKTNVTEMWSNGFSFLFDLEGSDHCDGRGPQPTGVFPRTLVAFGTSKPDGRSRYADDLRLRRWMGATREVMGDQRDKGHFIASSLGGEIIGGEPNVFPQRRDLNRGWSPAGKRFRRMEHFALKNPGTLYFHRAIYLCESETPDFLQVGIIRPDRSLWVEDFDNRL
jgi:hypothetical protein